MSLMQIISIILILDALGAVVLSWFGLFEGYYKRLGIIYKYFPPSKGWSMWYLVLASVIFALSFGIVN